MFFLPFLLLLPFLFLNLPLQLIPEHISLLVDPFYSHLLIPSQSLLILLYLFPFYFLSHFFLVPVSNPCIFAVNALQLLLAVHKVLIILFVHRVLLMLDRVSHCHSLVVLFLLSLLLLTFPLSLPLPLSQLFLHIPPMLIHNPLSPLKFFLHLSLVCLYNCPFCHNLCPLGLGGSSLLVIHDLHILAS